MSRKAQPHPRPHLPEYAIIFAALGDKTRLALVARLATGEPRSISQLADGLDLTRQAVTKHLHVLETAGIAHSTPAGRTTLYTLDTQPFENLKAYLDFVSDQWTDALSRLKGFVEE